MWAQLIKTRLKEGKGAEDLNRVTELLRAAEQPGSGLVRSTAMRDQKDPQAIYYLVVFESEEAARARERDPRRQAGLDEVRAAMAEAFDGSFEFVDLNVVSEHEG